MRPPVATDLATTALVLVVVDALFPFTDDLARLALDGAWPWIVAVAGFALLRGAVAVLYLATNAVVRTALPAEGRMHKDRSS